MACAFTFVRVQRPGAAGVVRLNAVRIGRDWSVCTVGYRDLTQVRISRGGSLTQLGVVRGRPLTKVRVAGRNSTKVRGARCRFQAEVLNG